MAQIWPDPWHFWDWGTVGAAGTGARHSLYINNDMYSGGSSKETYAANVGGFSTSYGAVSGGMGFANDNCAVSRHGVSYDNQIWQLRLNYPCPDDVVSGATFRYLNTAGFHSSAEMPSQGLHHALCLEVFAYMFGGRMRDVSGVTYASDFNSADDAGYYRLRIYASSSLLVTWELAAHDRLGTYLASPTTTPLTLDSGTFGASTIDWFSPFRLSIQVVQNGVNNDITCQIYQAPGSPTTLTNAFSHTNALRPTTNHFCGFSLPGGHLTNPFLGPQTTVRPVCEEFEVINYTTPPGTTVVLDDFERFGTTSTNTEDGMTVAVQGGGSVPMYHDQSMFLWSEQCFDQDSDDDGGDGSGPVLLQDVDDGDPTYAYTELAVPSGSDEAIHFMVCRIPPSDIEQQHRSIELRFHALPTSGTIGGGLCLRASCNRAQTEPEYTTAPAGDANGYAAYWYVPPSGSDPEVRISRFAAGVETVLASVVDSTPTWWPGTGVTMSFDFNLFRDSAQGVNAPVQMQVEVDSVAVTGWIAQAADVNIVTNTVEDVSSLKIASGGEGLFHFNNGETTARKIRFDRWAQETLGGEVEVPPGEQGEVTVSDEGTSSGSSLNDSLDPDFPFTTSYQAPSRRYEYESGHVHTEPMFLDLSDGSIRNRKLYSFSKASATETERDALLSFYDSHDGPEIPFDFTPPNEASAVVCHFVPDSLQHVELAPGIHSLAFQIQEVF